MVAVQCVWRAGSLFVFVSFYVCICVLFVFYICISYLHLFVFAVILVDNFKFQCDHLHRIQPLYIQHQCCNPYGKVTMMIVIVMIIPHCEVSESKHEHIFADAVRSAWRVWAGSHLPPCCCCCRLLLRLKESTCNRSSS